LSEPTLTLKPNREKSVLRRHPWIFSGAAARVDGEAAPGDTVIVRSASGDFLARAAYSPHSQIVARIWSWDESEPIDADFLRRRIARSIGARAALSETTNAARWVNAESDGLPGLIVDRYADIVVCLFLTAGAERWKNEIAEALGSQKGIVGVYERCDADVRSKEGLKSVEGVLRGMRPPDLVEVWERAPSTPSHPQKWRYAVDVLRGHKTGFYLDQRENRKVAFEFARRQSILNVFSYTAALTINGWWNNPTEIISLDSSAPSLALAKHNLTINNLPINGLTEGNAFQLLRKYRDEGQTFDLVILDPPKFAHSESQINKATRAYKDLNWLAFRILNPGGHLITFSCSGLISEDLFQKIVFSAALDAKRNAQIIQRLSQASDHPVLLSFPEAAYLKGFVCRVE